MMKEQEKMVPFVLNIKIAEDLQGAWGHYGAAMETHRHKNGTCLLITTTLQVFFLPVEGRLWGS